MRINHHNEIRKKVVQDVLDTHSNQFKEWQEFQKRKGSEPQEKIPSKSNFELSEKDKDLLAGHHKAIIEKIKKDDEDRNK